MSPDQEQYEPGPIEVTSEKIAKLSQNAQADRALQLDRNRSMKIGDKLIADFENRSLTGEVDIDPEAPNMKDLLIRLDNFVRDPDVDKSPTVPKSIAEALESIFSRQEPLMVRASEDRLIERGEPLASHKQMTLEGLLADHRTIHHSLETFRLEIADPIIERVLTPPLLAAIASYIPETSYFGHSPDRKDASPVLKSIAVRILTRQPAKAKLPEDTVSPVVYESRYKALTDIPKLRLAFQSAVVQVIRESAASNNDTDFRDRLDVVLRDIDAKLRHLTNGSGSASQNHRPH